MVSTSILTLSFSLALAMPMKSEWSVSAPIIHKNLAIYPVIDRRTSSVGTNYITLDEGLKSGQITITELSGSGTPLVRPRNGSQTTTPPNRQGGGGAQVNSLAVTNTSGKMLILMSGEMVVGGKQDRIIQKDGLVPPSKLPVSLEVFCVEHNRWSATDKVAFAPTTNSIAGGSGGAVADPTIRGAAQGANTQAKVWDKVDEKNRKSGVSGGGQTYQSTLNSEQNKRSSGEYLNAIRAKFPKRGVVGAIVSVNGKLIWADCFADDNIFQRYEAKLLTSYIVEAVTEVVPSSAFQHPSASKAKEFISDVSGASTFEGASRIYKLTRIEGKGHLIHELSDESGKSSLAIHFNKMLKQ